MTERESEVHGVAREEPRDVTGTATTTGGGPWRGPTPALAVGFALVVALTTCLFGEKIDINRGLGWDGAAYGAIAKDPYGELVTRGYPADIVQRSAPFVLAHLILRVYRAPIQDADVVQLFIFLDVLGITLTSWLVVRSLDVLGAAHARCGSACWRSRSTSRWRSGWPTIRCSPTSRAW